MKIVPLKNIYYTIMSTSTQPPIWFWIISGAVLVWNMTGAVAYVLQATMTPVMLSGLPPDQKAFYESYPAWATACFAFAVWGGLAGSIFLLMTRYWAFYAFLISTAGVIGQNTYNLVISDGLQIFGIGGLSLPLAVIAINLLLLRFIYKIKRRRWVR